MNEHESSPKPITNLLLTGRPGVGKTTLVLEVARSLTAVGGFFTRELREGGKRVGFSIESFDGREGVLSHQDLKSTHRVGRYGVNIPDIDRVAVESILSGLSHQEIRYLVIDEIARMELFSERFQSAVFSALNNGKPVLATIQMRDDPFLKTIRSRHDVRLIEVTKGNRDALPGTVVKLLQEM